MKERVKALKAFTFGTDKKVKGDEFMVSPSQAAGLKASGHAKPVVAKAPSVDGDGQ